MKALTPQFLRILLVVAVFLFAGTPAQAADTVMTPDLTGHWAAIASIIIFIIAYALVIAEENIHLRKSKPVMFAAGLIWILVAVTYGQNGQSEVVEGLVQHGLLEFVELFLFLLAAMTYINTMDERGVFDVLRSWLLKQRFSLRKLFWVTGGLAFVLSPVADNLTTALLMATVVMAVGGQNRRFVVISCINVVVAANAGGAFSPFGDITTLMVWQEGHVQFSEFFALVIPSVVNWLVTAGLLSFFIPAGQPDVVNEEAYLRHGAVIVIGLFIATIFLAVASHTLLHLPPVIGMMTGLGALKLFGYYLQLHDHRFSRTPERVMNDTALTLEGDPRKTPSSSDPQYDIYRNLQRVEWDTLLFFYGIMLCVAGLGAFGYLAVGSDLLYGALGPTTANILVGFASAVFDNIPVMFAVLEMSPEMSLGQWQLITLTAGVGGSMLAVGSAAGVAVMGQARGVYTFMSHLKWSWAIVIGYAASVATHLMLNGSLM
ncbi:MAG: Na+/H+ antiporter NhaD/arsenite permease-like protein [Woeseiaceae bacterium]|jgi:Na+/H+ antiporter NhaD/arsenite permease-like protein